MVPVARMSLRLCLLLVLLAAGCRTDAPARLPGGLADEDSPADLVALLGDLVPRIERLSGLEQRETFRIRRQTRAQVREYVEARLDAEMPPDRLAGIQRLYVALGLMEDTLNLRALLLDLYTEQVLGYYDPAERTLFVLEGETAAGLRPLLAHELVHALQDQHTDIDSLVAYERGNDRQAAAHAALEGHAMVVMFAVLAEEATRRRIDPVALPDPSLELGDALDAQNREFPVFARAPAIIRETLLFPYVHGASFVHQLWSSMAPLERYPAPIDTLLPQSTADVLAPQRFIAQRRAPVEVRFAGVPAGWDVVYENTLGRLEAEVLLGAHGGPAARAAADGWIGDRALLATRTGAGDVVHWITLWESAASAARFAATVAGLGRGPGWVVADEVVAGHPAVRVTVGHPPAAAAAAGVPAVTATDQPAGR